MRKNKQTWSVKTLVFLALLVAIQLVLSRVLVIDLGVYRITLGRLWRESSDHFICNHLGRSCRSSRQADG